MKRYLAVMAAVCMLCTCFGCGQAEETVQEQSVEESQTIEGAAQEQGEDASEALSGTAQEQGEDASKTSDGTAQESETDELEIGADALEKDELEVPEGGRRLTAAELQEYTEWLQESSNYGFLLSDWENPAQIDLYQVFYSGAGISRPGTEEEKKAHLERYDQPEVYTDFYAMDRAAVNFFLMEKLDLSYAELLAKGNKGIENIYYAETDSFCIEAGDTNYCQFTCRDGVVNADGTIVTLLCNGDDWYRTCEVTLGVSEGRWMFLGNHILEGMVLSRQEETESQRGDCLIDVHYFENLHTDADASAVESSYVLGDWSKITKESMKGVWYYHPKDAGESTEYDVLLQLDEQAVVYYPAVDFHGDVAYEWDIVDRSDRGLCPELAIYFRGTKEGELAWYVLGISEERDYFWCNGEVFYRQ